MYIEADACVLKLLNGLYELLNVFLSSFGLNLENFL